MTETRRLQRRLAKGTEALRRRPLVLVERDHLFNAVLVKDVSRRSKRAPKRSEVLAVLEFTHAYAAILQLFKFQGIPASRLDDFDGNIGGLYLCSPGCLFRLGIRATVSAAYYAHAKYDDNCDHTANDQSGVKILNRNSRAASTSAAGSKDFIAIFAAAIRSSVVPVTIVATAVCPFFVVETSLFIGSTLILADAAGIKYP